MDDRTAFEEFKWNLLLDLAIVDHYGLWEQPWIDAGEWVEQALRELYREGLIYFFRVSAPSLVNESGADPALRLSEVEVARELDRGLRTDWSRAFAPENADLPDIWTDLPDIWIGSTPEGEAAANDAPEAARKRWRS